VGFCRPRARVQAHRLSSVLAVHEGVPERWIIILRAIYPWRNFPHSHPVGRVGEQERFQISVGLYSVTLTEYFPFSEATPHSACCALRKGRRDIVWASSKLRRSTSVIATSFCLWSLCGGNKAGLNYLIISELSEAEMEKLEGLLRERANSSGRGRMCGSVE
jgi:hypothetical protein